MKSFSYTIQDPMGLHARPAGQLVKQAQQFRSAITLQYGEKQVDFKKLFAVMSLAVKQGETITVAVEGDDEAAAARQLQAFIGANF